MVPLMGVGAVTDRGLRHHRNEDAFAVCETATPDGTPALITVVCDGVSSASRPHEASAVAATTAGGALRESLSRGVRPPAAMYEALLAAADAVSALADPAEDNTPACTCVSAITVGDLVTVGWVGDSRAYWIPDDRAGERPARLTEDDSWAARVVEAGLMSEAEAYADPRAHAITGWLGADAVDLAPHTASFQPDRPGVVVVCTDGLWNYAESAEEMAAVVPADARTNPLRCARTLADVALNGGGHDNITIAVMAFPGLAAER
jgi:serine/threonine protein phosphatase PrpC